MSLEVDLVFVEYNLNDGLTDGVFDNPQVAVEGWGGIRVLGLWGPGFQIKGYRVQGLMPWMMADG